MLARTILIFAFLLPLAFGCGDDDSAPIDSEIRSLQVAAGDFTFDVRVAGPAEGEPVILLHGFPETSLEWRFQLRELASLGYRAIAPDQRGYSAGARPAAVEDYHVDLLILDVLLLADALGIDRFHLVGHDWGAAVAWGVAGEAPQRVRSLTALSVPHPDPFSDAVADPTSCQYNASGYFDLFVSDGAADLFLRNDAAFLRGVYAGFPSEIVDQYVSTLSEPGAMQAALNWYSANVGARDIALPRLGIIEVPTLFVWSDQDFAICRDSAERTARFVDAPYEFVVLAGVDHWIPERVPEAVTSLLLEHFERVATR